MPATFDNIIETEAAKLTVQAIELIEELIPFSPESKLLDIKDMDKWDIQLRIIFSRMLVLKLRLEICHGSYRVIWPCKGGLLDRREMEQVQATDTPQEVAFPCFPGIETRTPHYDPIVAQHAMVETIGCRTTDDAGMRKAIADARDIV